MQRVEMARLATQDEPWLEVSEMELGRPGKSYTSDTLRALAEQYPNDTLYLLMGTDMFLSLHTWHEPDVICHLAVIVGMHREEDKDGTMEQQKSLLEERFGGQGCGAPQCASGDFLHPPAAECCFRWRQDIT